MCLVTALLFIMLTYIRYSTAAVISSNAAHYEIMAVKIVSKPLYADNSRIVGRTRQQRVFTSCTRRLPHRFYGLSPSSNIRQRSRKSVTLSSSPLSSSFSSYFQPSEPPPTFTGKAIFPDINLTQRATSYAATRNEDPTATFVVTGASRGIGCQLVKTLLQRTKGQILACCRLPTKTNTPLHKFLSSVSQTDRIRVTLCRLDLEDQSTIDQLQHDIHTNFNSRVDVLWNVAGLLGDGGISTPGPERSVTKLDRSFSERSFAINTIGPMMLCQALIPMMKVSRVTTTGSQVQEPSRAPSLIVNLSARVGSISDNNLGGWYSYRCSKAAMNQFTRTLAQETTRRQRTWAVSLHPGTTDTDLSAPFQKNVRPGKLFPVDFTANRMLDLVDCLEEKHSGGFYDWAGKALPF